MHQPISKPRVRLVGLARASTGRGGAALASGLLVALMSVATASAEDPTPARQNELLYRLEQDCGSCHGMTLKGGLGPSLLPGDLADKPDEALVDAILHGRPGTPMPPWAFELSEQDADWLVRVLRTGVR